MSDVHIVYVPVGRSTFHVETAAKYFKDSVEYLKQLSVPVACPENILFDPSEVSSFLDQENKKSPVDLIILQCTTFTDNRFAIAVMEKTNCPVFIWGVAEPSFDGGRLKLNSLTGFLGLSNALCHYGRSFDAAYGAPGEEQIEKALMRQIKAASLVSNLKRSRIGVIGTLPPGFTLSDVDVLALQRDIGPTYISTELHQIINAGKAMPKDKIEAALKEVAAQVPEFSLPDDKALLFGGFYAALKDFIARENLDMIAARCWPDVFEELAIAPCAAYSVLTETLPVACEVDINGAISMYMLTQLAGSPCFFGDPAALDTKNDIVAFWHCGHGAPSLANPKQNPRMGVQPNRLMAPALDSIAKPGRVTVMRLGNAPGGGFRVFIARGEAQDCPRPFQGTSMNLKIDAGSYNFVTRAAQEGWEYHFAVVYGDVADEMALAAKFMGLPVTMM